MIPDDLISISEAIQRYGRTKSWWFKQISEKALDGYHVPGYRETHVSNDQASTIVQPRKLGQQNDQTA